MLAERIKVSPRRISVAGQEEVWSVGVVAPVSEETGWGFGPTCNIAYMHALKNLEKALVQTDQLKGNALADLLRGTLPYPAAHYRRRNEHRKNNK